MGFHDDFFHPHLTSPIKGEEVLMELQQIEQSSAPFEGAS
jgi:hypothetical protein